MCNDLAKAMKALDGKKKGIVTAYRTLYRSYLSSLLKFTVVKTCLHQLIEFDNIQLAYRHDERPGESYEALDGKKNSNAGTNCKRVTFEFVNHYTLYGNLLLPTPLTCGSLSPIPIPFKLGDGPG